MPVAYLRYPEIKSIPCSQIWYDCYCLKYSTHRWTGERESEAHRVCTQQWLADKFSYILLGNSVLSKEFFCLFLCVIQEDNSQACPVCGSSVGSCSSAGAFYSDPGKGILQLWGGCYHPKLPEKCWVFHEPFPVHELTLTNPPPDVSTSLEDKSDYEQWRRNRRKLGKRYIGIAEIAYTHYSEPEEGAEGQRKDSGSNPGCVEATFGCQLAKVSVTVLSAVLFQSIGKLPGENSWMRNIPGPQQCTCSWSCWERHSSFRAGALRSPAVVGTAPGPLWNIWLGMTSLMPYGAFWPRMQGGHRFFQQRGDAFPVWFTSRWGKRERIDQASWEKNISPRKCSCEKCVIALWPKCFPRWNIVFSSLGAGKGRI